MERKHIKIIRKRMCANDVSRKLYKYFEEAKSQNATEEEMPLQYLQQGARCDISLILMDPADDFFAPSYERLAHRRRVGHTKINCVWIVRMLNSPAGWNRRQLMQWVGSQALMRASDAQWTAIQEWGSTECHLLAMAEPLRGRRLGCGQRLPHAARRVKPAYYTEELARIRAGARVNGVGTDVCRPFAPSAHAPQMRIYPLAEV